MNYSMSHRRMPLKIHVDCIKCPSNSYDIRLDACLVFFFFVQFHTLKELENILHPPYLSRWLYCTVNFPLDCDKSTLMNLISYLFLLQNQTLRSKCLRPSVPRERPQRSARRGPLPTSSPCSTNHRSRSSRRPLI